MRLNGTTNCVRWSTLIASSCTHVHRLDHPSQATRGRDPARPVAAQALRGEHHAASLGRRQAVAEQHYDPARDRAIAAHAIAAAALTLSDSTWPCIGIDAMTSHRDRARRESPRPSAPSTSTIG